MNLIEVSFQSTTVGGTTYPIVHEGGTANLTTVDGGWLGSKDGTNVWNWTHVGDGSGYNGRNYMRLDRWEDEDGNPQTGWFIGGTSVAPSGGWEAKAKAGPLYARFRIRVNAPFTLGADQSAQMKFFIFGGPGINGERRMIFSLDRAEHYGGTGCTDDDTRQGINMIAGVSGNRAVTCIPLNEWVHIQLAWQYSDVGSPYMRIYVNENNIASPTAEHTAFTADEMGGVWSAPEPVPGESDTAWDDVRLCSIVSTNSYTGTDAQFDLMDFIVADDFDDEWAPGGTPTPAVRLFRGVAGGL